MRPGLPDRKTLPHDVPPWARRDDLYFITICAPPKGTNQLCQTDCAPALLDAAREYQAQERWHALILLLMPDHVHLLAGFAQETKMQATVSAWKRYTARQLDIRGQRDFFEHRIRLHESAEAKVEYIRMNPVRAGLVASPGDWPWVILSSEMV